MNKKWLMYGACFLAGVIVAGRVRGLPVLDKLPTV